MSQFPGLVGSSYQAQFPIEDVERTVNWFVENIESGEGKSRQALLPTPGTTLFGMMAATGHRGAFSLAQRAFSVVGSNFTEVFIDGTSVVRGTVSSNGQPVSMAANGVGEICIISNQSGYIYNALTNTFNQITADGFIGANQVVSVDGYFICAKPNSNTFFISGLDNGLSWDALDFANTEGEAGNIVSIIANFREIWLLCETHTEVYYDSGDPDFPFARTGGGFLEKGSGAVFSPAALDNSIFWLYQEQAGGRMVMRSNGYQPVRVSDHAVEWAMSQYATVADAVSWTYQYSGHSFYVLCFPTAGATWVYDVSTSKWHERAAFTGGVYIRYKPATHMHCFGKHLVGDYSSGKLFSLDPNVYTDDGNPLVRTRIAPHLGNELNRNFYDELELDCQVGMGLPSGQGSDPKIILQVSRDGGKTFGNEQPRGLGKMGQFRARVVWRRLGYARDLVFKLVMTDPVPVAIVNAYLRVRNGN